MNKKKILVCGIIILSFIIILTNFTVYEEGDFDSVQDEIVIVCDTNWYKQPINCKPVFPDGFDFNSDSITAETPVP